MKNVVFDRLFPDALICNQRNDKPYTVEEINHLWNIYLAGAPPFRIAALMKRNWKSIKRQLEQGTYNERGWADRYEPVGRYWRGGRKKLTENDRVIIEAHAERGVSKNTTAKLLQIDVSEF